MEPLPPQPQIAAIIMARSNTGAAKASLAAQALRPRRVSACLRTSIHKSIASIGKTQRIDKRFAGFRNKEEGGVGINKPLAMVLTLIVNTAGPVVVTVTGEGAPTHVALEGAPVQVTVTVS